MEINLKEFTPIKGFETTHLINKYTQEVYSLIRKRILKGSINEGYKVYHLKNSDGIVKMRPLHRLMMETFVTNCNNYPIINHKDGNKFNNSLENLEWCSYSYNNKEAYRLGIRKVSSKTIEQFKRDCLKPQNIEIAKDNLRKSKEKAIRSSKEVNSYKVKLTKNNDVMIFDSCSDASKFLNVCKSSVCRALKRKNNYINDYKIEKIL